MDPEKLLTTTMTHLDNAGVPDALRPVAFPKVFDLLVGKPSLLASNLGDRNLVDRANGEGAPLQQIANKLNVDIGVVERVYAFEDGEVELVVPAKNLKGAKSQATADIAVLVAAGRQAVGLDEGWTSVDAVRKWCENYKKYDSGNFASTIKSLDTVMTVRGAGRDRKLKMTSPAWSKAAELVESLGT
jgi:hypothetical protein